MRVGAEVSGSIPVMLFGKAMTSRIDALSRRRDNNRSKPIANLRAADSRVQCVQEVRELQSHALPCPYNRYVLYAQEFLHDIELQIVVDEFGAIYSSQRD